jgi:hypothetical protein
MSSSQSHRIRGFSRTEKSEKGWSSAKRLSPVLILAGSLAAVFLAGGQHQVAVGLFFTLSGMVLMLIPPRQTSPGIFWTMGFFLVILCSLSLFPCLIPTGLPAWRIFLESSSGIHLPECVSLSPYDTVGWIVMLSFSVMVALYLLGFPMKEREQGIAAMIAVGGVSVYTLLSLISWNSGWSYPFFIPEPDYPKVFGFFPNRNHSAGFLATGAILALGLVHSRGQQLFLQRVFGLLAFMFVAYCLFFVSVSRGGVISLVLGAVIWLLGLGSRDRPWWLLICIFLVAGFFVMRFADSDSALLQRFRPTVFVSQAEGAPAVKTDSSKSSSALSSDARIALAKDTVRIIHDYP